MHFGKQLNLLAYQPWKEYYLNFDLLKKVIKDILKKGKEEGRVLMLGKEEANRMREMKLEGSEGGKDSFSKYLNRKSDNGSSRDDENSIEGVRVPEYRYSNSFDGMEIEDGMEMLFISEFDEPKKTSPEDEDESKSKEEEEKREEVVILTEELTDMFLIALKNERDKVNAFFVSELRKRYKEIEAIERAVQVKKNNNSPLLPLKKRYFDLMVLVEEMIDFARLNLVGFTKIIKKFIRCTDYTKRADLIAEINLSDFVSKGPELDSVKAKITASYTKTFNDPADKSSGLKLEKELEQSVIAARSWKFNTILFQIDEHMNKVTIVPPRKSGGAIPVLIAAILLAIFLYVPIFHEDDMPAQRCLAVLICATVMWVSECCPLFVTSMVVIVFGALTGVLLDEKGNILEPEAAASKIFTKLYPSSVPLVLAGFSISAAFKKYKIDMLIANFILGSRFFRTPARFVAAVEFLCFFMSMWVSNVAASVLTLTVIMPIIRDLPDNCMYVRTLLMATAVSGNVGGMTTQIASPQNSVTVSLGEYSVGFVEFIGASILICPFLLVTGHFLVMYLYKPDIEVLPGLDDSASAGAGAEPESSVQATAATLRAVQDSQKTAPELPFYKRIDLRVLATAIITLLSIVLWVASNWLKPFGCNIGLISFVPLCLFYGSGLLTKEDFEALPWNLPMLLAGGNILGYAVESSKLLSMVSGLLENLPNNTFVLVVVCGFIMMIAGSFVSHTVAALILLNLFAEVGTFVGHPKLLVMTSVIVCSGAMPLPVSSFPNLNAISLCDQNGNSYLKTVDFLKVGITQTVVAYIFSCTITYGMSLLIGF